MGFSDKIGEAVLTAFSELTPELRGIDRDARGYSRTGWQAFHTTAVGASGAVSVVVPVAHLATLVADVGFLINRMAICAFGIGGIAAKEKGKGFILEEEDMPAILARWAGDDSVSDAAIAKMASTGAAAFAGQPLAAVFAKIAVKHAGLLVGKKLGGKVGAKVAAKFVGKYMGKATAGFIPFVGPGICAGINVWFISEMAAAASSWYATKLRWEDGGSGAAGLVPA